MTREAVKTLTGVKIDGDYPVVVLHREFFRRITRLLDETPTETLLNYLVLKIMLDYAPATTDQMKRLHRIFAAVPDGVAGEPPRWKTCVRSANHYFSSKISSMYIGEEDGLETREEILGVLDALKEAFGEIINELEWMDDGGGKKLTRSECP